MQPAAAQLATKLATIQINTPIVPVLHNADVVAYNDAEQIRDALVRQLYQPVRWAETVQKMAADGITVLAECGPGKVLAGLTKRICADVQGVALVDAASIEQLKAVL